MSLSIVTGNATHLFSYFLLLTTKDEHHWYPIENALQIVALLKPHDKKF